MTVTRRTFLLSSTYTGVGLALASAIEAEPLWAIDKDEQLIAYGHFLEPYLSGMRMASTPATAYRAYRSRVVTNPHLNTWVQIDLNERIPIEAIQLFPASERGYPGRDQYYSGEGFPLRFRIEASDDPDFIQHQSIADFTQSDFPDPKDNITRYTGKGIHARYVRLTATCLRPIKILANTDEGLPLGGETKDSRYHTLTLAKLAVISSGNDVAIGCKVSADKEYGNNDLLSQLTRPYRQDGEGVHHDNPHLVTDASIWKPVKYQAEAPLTGVTLNGGVFESVMRNNIEYLLSTYSTDDLLRQFYERVGKVRNFKPTGPQIFWEEDLAGSNAGRFLMGAGNTLRWIDHPELRRRLNVVVDGIEECRQPNGYIMAYPEDTIFYSERAAYTRAWLTHGLLEAAYSGNPKALPLLRGYYDWFNQQAFLPEMLRGTPQGGQGMVANTRVHLSPIGEPADAQVIQRYYEERAWLNGLMKQEKKQVWQYPYDHPHCYLLTDLEAYLDMYRATGELHYRDAVLGGWELYRAHWQHAGGSISIIEFENDPPDSNYIHRKLGELCGSSFWTFLSQRLHLMNPDEERYVAEIEKSIYNVGMANQDGSIGIRYHTILEGKKEKSTHENTCCEGQGTRLLGSLPEHIYSIASDGLYVNLYEPSTVHWQQGGQPIEITIKTRFPFENKVRITVKTSAKTQANLRIRIPSWANTEMKLSVNGKAVGTGKPGTYYALDRQWSNGDTIEFTLPAAIHVKLYTGKDQIVNEKRYSIEYGPILLAAVGSTKLHLIADAEHFANDIEPLANSPLHFTIRGNRGQELMPYWQISQQQEFTCYPVISTAT